ncbi:MAG: Calcium-transporting ATPase [Promethearchaeota archaeon]|nr:MAG: Calcium-transporting ATPase [Candidatus Lokiarchaeota archaeon]
MVGLEDPIREEVKDAINECKQAGIHVLLITGDYEKTAKTVAEKLGIDARKVVLGHEIEEMSKEDLQGRVKYIEVFARATPEHKLKIVEALKANGEQVAVTGDGINDAPALKRADIGVAMGQTGTDVAREASDMVLLDDNFATITLSVKEGRKLYDNLKKGVRYYLAVKLALIVIFLLPVLFNIQLPFAPIQIILLELFMDLAASATFVIEPSESDVMERTPRDPEEKFMDFRMNLWILLGALSLIGAVLSIYFGFYWLGPDIARTMAFGTWMVTHVFLALNMRTEEDPIIEVGILSNKAMIIWGVGAIAAMFVIMYVPALQTVFRVVSLNFLEWLVIFGVSIGTTFWIEVVKVLIQRRFSK